MFPAFLILIVVNVIVFCLPYLVDFSARGYSSFDRFLTLGWKDNHDIKNGEYYRIITAMFLHADGFHLFFNMYALYIFGIGFTTNTLLFIAIYFASGIAGNLASFFFDSRPTVGASGAIFGLVGFLFVFSLLQGATANILNLGLYVVISFVIANMPGSKIDIAGHLGGLLAGSLIALVIAL